MLLRPSMWAEEMRGQSWKRDCTSAKGQPERNITPFPEKEKLPYSSLLCCIEPLYTDAPKLITWVAIWTITKHSQVRMTVLNWGLYSLWLWMERVKPFLHLDAKFLRLHFKEWGQVLLRNVCALTLCPWSLMRWQKDQGPESGVLGLNLRSVLETFQQPSKCMHYRLFISQDVFHF